MGEQAFFQIAVGLIPVLLFGGVLFGQREGPDLNGPFRRRDAALLVGAVVIGLAAIVAETIAIGGAVGAEPKTPGKLLVIGVILLGMLLVVLAGLLPRALHMLASAPKQTTVPMRLALIGLACAFVLTAVLSAAQVDEAIRIGNSEANVQEAERLQGQIESIRNRDDSRRRRINGLYLEWERLLAKPAAGSLDRARLRNLKLELRTEERASRDDLDQVFELERRIRRLST